MANPPRQPLTTPPNPMLLQGEPPGRDDPKATLLALLQDPEVRAAIVAILPQAASAVLVNIPTEPDAALATWVQDLIEQKLRQQIRSDAFRLPR